MNKRGAIGLTIIAIIMTFLIGFLMVNFLFDEVTNARTNLSCSSPNDISDATKLMCLAIDTTIIYWILGILSVIIGVIVGGML